MEYNNKKYPSRKNRREDEDGYTEQQEAALRIDQLIAVIKKKTNCKQIYQLQQQFEEISRLNIEVQRKASLANCLEDLQKLIDLFNKIILEIMQTIHHDKLANHYQSFKQIATKIKKFQPNQQQMNSIKMKRRLIQELKQQQQRRIKAQKQLDVMLSATKESFSKKEEKIKQLQQKINQLTMQLHEKNRNLKQKQAIIYNKKNLRSHEQQFDRNQLNNSSNVHLRMQSPKYKNKTNQQNFEYSHQPQNNNIHNFQTRKTIQNNKRGQFKHTDSLSNTLQKNQLIIQKNNIQLQTKINQNDNSHSHQSQNSSSYQNHMNQTSHQSSYKSSQKSNKHNNQNNNYTYDQRMEMEVKRSEDKFLKQQRINKIQLMNPNEMINNNKLNGIQNQNTQHFFNLLTGENELMEIKNKEEKIYQSISKQQSDRKKAMKNKDFNNNQYSNGQINNNNYRSLKNIKQQLKETQNQSKGVFNQQIYDNIKRTSIQSQKPNQNYQSSQLLDNQIKIKTDDGYENKKNLIKSQQEINQYSRNLRTVREDQETIKINSPKSQLISPTKSEREKKFSNKNDLDSKGDMLKLLHMQAYAIQMLLKQG